MERELRLKAFIEEYARVVQLFDDIVSMKESMGRLETYMVVMVCQVGATMIVGSILFSRLGILWIKQNRAGGYISCMMQLTYFCFFVHFSDTLRNRLFKYCQFDCFFFKELPIRALVLANRHQFFVTIAFSSTVLDAFSLKLLKLKISTLSCTRYYSNYTLVHLLCFTHARMFSGREETCPQSSLVMKDHQSQRFPSGFSPHTPSLVYLTTEGLLSTIIPGSSPPGYQISAIFLLRSSWHFRSGLEHCCLLEIHLLLVQPKDFFCHCVLP